MNDIGVYKEENSESDGWKLPVDNYTALLDLTTSTTLYWMRKSCEVNWKRRSILRCLKRQAAATIIQRWFRRTSSKLISSKRYARCLHANQSTSCKVSSFTLSSCDKVQGDKKVMSVLEEISKLTKTKDINIAQPAQQFMDEIFKGLDKVKFDFDLSTELQVYHVLETGDLNQIHDTIGEEVEVDPTRCMHCGELVTARPAVQKDKKEWTTKANKTLNMADVVLQYIKQQKAALSFQRWFEPSTKEFLVAKVKETSNQHENAERKSMDEDISFYLDMQNDSDTLRNWCSTPNKKGIIAKHLKNHVAAITIQQWYREKKSKNTEKLVRDPFLIFLLRNDSSELLQIWYEKNKWKRNYIIEQLKFDFVIETPTEMTTVEEKVDQRNIDSFEVDNTVFENQVKENKCFTLVKGNSMEELISTGIENLTDNLFDPIINKKEQKSSLSENPMHEIANRSIDNNHDVVFGHITNRNLNKYLLRRKAIGKIVNCEEETKFKLKTSFESVVKEKHFDSLKENDLIEKSISDRSKNDFDVHKFLKSAIRNHEEGISQFLEIPLEEKPEKLFKEEEDRLRQSFELPKKKFGDKSHDLETRDKETTKLLKLPSGEVSESSMPKEQQKTPTKVKKLEVQKEVKPEKQSKKSCCSVV